MVGSNLGWDTLYPDFFLLFSSDLSCKCSDITLIRHDRFLPDPFQFIIHQSSYHSIQYNVSCCHHHKPGHGKQTFPHGCHLVVLSGHSYLLVARVEGTWYVYNLQMVSAQLTFLRKQSPFQVRGEVAPYLVSEGSSIFCPYGTPVK
jgi:hypothetical protein